MWKQIIANVNAVILKNWASVVCFVLGCLAGTFLISCAMTNKLVDGTQEVLTDGVEWMMEGQAEEVE